VAGLLKVKAEFRQWTFKWTKSNGKMPVPE
jgi:hypothetical protein